MPRLMSVAFTEDAVRNRTKTVTRRKGWTFLKPGDRLTLCRKVMGRKPGEPLDRICDVEVVSVERQRLRWLYDPGMPVTEWQHAEMRREGFPGLHPKEFIQRFFVDAQGINAEDFVTRIEWRYLEGADPVHGFTTQEDDQ